MTTSKRYASRAVTLGAVPILAVAFGACGDDETAYCVDSADQIVENRYCGDEDDGGSSSFFWFYGGDTHGVAAARGVRVHPTKGSTKIVSTNKAAIVSRGGFGSSSKASGVGRASSGGG